MALRRGRLKDNLMFLKWNILLLLLCVGASLSAYLYAISQQAQWQRQELALRQNLDRIEGQLATIEEARSAILDNLEIYNQIVSSPVMQEEDRILLVEEIRNIRSSNKLFPIELQIAEQVREYLPAETGNESPSEQVSLRTTPIDISVPLLHEGDFSVFLGQLLTEDRLLFPVYCYIEATGAPIVDLADYSPKLNADCQFYWYTLRIEPYSGS